MRGGEELTPMTPDLLCRIFSEASVDYSSEVCSRASLKDLSDTAITTLRVRWAARCTNRNILDASKDQLLEDLGLLTDGAVTIAALVLLGSQDALRRYLPQAEVVFEYRASESSLPFQQRREYREDFLSFGEDLWETINLRNEIYQYQEGLFMREIPTFNEAVVREAVLNAISHRDYRLAESIFVRQYPRKLEIVSPGGFPPGIETFEHPMAPVSPQPEDCRSACQMRPRGTVRTRRGPDVRGVREGEQTIPKNPRKESAPRWGTPGPMRRPTASSGHLTIPACAGTWESPR